MIGDRRQRASPPPSWISTLLAVVSVAGCAAPAHEAHWGQLRVGMSKDEVRTVLGRPSSSVVLRDHAAPAGAAAPAAATGERWQYGDTLSSLATGAVFPDQADERAWCVFFSPGGAVTGFLPPAWATSAQSVAPAPAMN